MSLMSHVAEKLQQAIADMRAESAELRDTAEELERAWAAWDVERIASILQLSEGDVETLREELDETEMDEEDW